MERVFQRSFKPSHYHTSGHTRDAFEGGNDHHCSWSPPTCQNTEGWEGCRLRRNPTWNSQSFESRSSLAESCVLSGLVFWKCTERLEIWGDHPIHKKGARSECSYYRSICLLSPSGKVYAKCLEERYREIIEAKLDDTQCVPIVALQNKFSLSSNFREILGVCQRRLHMFCGPRYSIRPSSSWKAVEVFSGAQCWQPPVTGCQVTVFLLRSLCSCRRSLTTTVHSVSWTPTRVCAVTTPPHSHMNWSVKV